MTIDERISAELRRHAPEVDEHAAWDRIQSAVPPGRRYWTPRPVAVGVATAGLLVVASILVSTLSSAPGPFAGPQSPFVGTWVTADGDGSTPTMTLEVSGDGVVEIVVVDDFASVCSGAPSTMTGSGRLDSETQLVIPSPAMTCDDGSVAQALSGPPLEEQLRNLTFVYDPLSDTLTDSFGSIWSREGSEEPQPDPAATGWWPQSNLEEVRAAQELADAGDPAYTWQVDAGLAAEDPGLKSSGSEIYARFIEQKLGWEQYVSGASFMGVPNVFVRCAPGRANPMADLFAEIPVEMRTCAPTVDDFTYESVSIFLRQPGLRGPSGIWVVERWEMLQPDSGPGLLYGLLYPDFPAWQFAQTVPPSDAEVSALLDAFLRARVDGEGAEQYLLREPDQSRFEAAIVPVLYATTGGAPYESFEFERLQGPVWPTGWFEYQVRLFTGTDTVVEQRFHIVRHEGKLGLVYGYVFDGVPTTENGQSVPLHYNILDGEVTFAAAPPWGPWWSESPSVMTLNGGRNENVVIAADPLTTGAGCEMGPAAADAETLARSIAADPDFETIGTTPVRIAGVDGLQIDLDVVATGGTVCAWDQWVLEVQGIPNAGYGEFRMRLYLIDYPGESAQVLAIAIIASDDVFERVLEEAQPIIDSIEFHTG